LIVTTRDLDAIQMGALDHDLLTVLQRHDLGLQFSELGTQADLYKVPIPWVT
jgi:hypothetical protein